MQSNTNTSKNFAIRYFLNFLCIIFGFWMGVNLSFTLRFISLKWYQTEIIDENAEIDMKINWINSVEKTMVEKLTKNVNLLCWVMHTENSHDRRSAIMDTWGRRCNKIIFVIGKPNINDTLVVDRLFKNADLVTFRMTDKYEYLWLKTKLAFKYIVNEYKNKFDWVLKIDDDSFVIVENLKLFLYYKNIHSNFFYGFQFKNKASKGYASGGSGYVMSMINAQKLVETFSMHECYQGDDGPEDVQVAQCLSLLGVYPADTRDSNNRIRFIMSSLKAFLYPEGYKKRAEWFANFSMHSVKDGYECCSDKAISFHQISSIEIRIMEYLIYYVHPFSDRNIWEPVNV